MNKHDMCGKSEAAQELAIIGERFGRRGERQAAGDQTAVAEAGMETPGQHKERLINAFGCAKLAV